MQIIRYKSRNSRHGSKTRAFYAKKRFLEEIMTRKNIIVVKPNLVLTECEPQAAPF